MEELDGGKEFNLKFFKKVPAPGLPDGQRFPVQCKSGEGRNSDFGKDY